MSIWIGLLASATLAQSTPPPADYRVLFKIDVAVLAIDAASWSRRPDGTVRAVSALLMRPPSGHASGGSAAQVALVGDVYANCEAETLGAGPITVYHPDLTVADEVPGDMAFYPLDGEEDRQILDFMCGKPGARVSPERQSHPDLRSLFASAGAK